MKGVFIAGFLCAGISLCAQNFPASARTHSHTLMATGRATGKRSPEIERKLRKDYSRIVRNERQIKKYSAQNHRQLDQEFKRTDHSARWVLRHKAQVLSRS